MIVITARVGRTGFEYPRSRMARQPKQSSIVQFELAQAEKTRLRLIALQTTAELDFPCAVRLVTGVRASPRMRTIPLNELTRWLGLVEDAYLCALAKAAAKDRRDTQIGYDELPTIDAYLDEHDTTSGRLLKFAHWVLRLSDEDKRTGIIEASGAPPNSEAMEFAPRRRGLGRGLGTGAPDIAECPPYWHAIIIRMALMAIGPMAANKPRVARHRRRDHQFRPLWSLAREQCMPYMWLGNGDAQDALTELYIGECAGLVRTEYDWWVTKGIETSDESNPILRWLSEPTEANRLGALHFVTRFTSSRTVCSPQAPGHVQSACPSPAKTAVNCSPERQKKRCGKPPISDREARSRSDLLEKWNKAKAAQVPQKDFCTQEGISLKHLTTCINWAATRRRRVQSP